MNKTPALAHLMGAYFHQDWGFDYADVGAAVDDFVEGEPALAPRLADEIDEVLASFTDEASLDAYLQGIGSNYTAEDGETYRGWLTEIARRVEAATS
jgi:hypothetical protein